MFSKPLNNAVTGETRCWLRIFKGISRPSHVFQATASHDPFTSKAALSQGYRRVQPLKSSRLYKPSDRAPWALCRAPTSLSRLADEWPTTPAKAFASRLAIHRSSFAFRNLLEESQSLFTFLVDPVGFEPTTFSMPLRRAPNCAMGP
jgi:hypothetical protein